jgi:hypothetical protein
MSWLVRIHTNDCDMDRTHILGINKSVYLFAVSTIALLTLFSCSFICWRRGNTNTFWCSTVCVWFANDGQLFDCELHLHKRHFIVAYHTGWLLYHSAAHILMIVGSSYICINGPFLMHLAIDVRRVDCQFRPRDQPQANLTYWLLYCSFDLPTDNLS